MTNESSDGHGSSYLERARRDVLRGSAWTFAATVVAMPVSLGANIALARGLGSAGLGRFATYTAIFAIISAVANFGWSDATGQWLATATARDERESRLLLIRRCTGFHLAVSAPLTAVGAGVLLWTTGPVEAIAAAAAVFVTEVIGTGTVVNTASTRNSASAKIALVSATATQAGLVAAALASHRPGLTWAVLCLFGLMAPAMALLRLTPEERAAMLRPSLALRPARGWWTYALSACIGGLVATLVFGRSEVLVLRWNHLLVATGVFTVITGLAGQMTSALDSLLAPLVPMAAGLVALERKRAVRVFNTALRFTGLLGVVAACVFVPVGVVAIRPLYGHGFHQASVPFAVLGLISCTQTMLGPFDAFAFATRSAGRILRINLVSLGIDAVLAISLVPLLGLWGAVIANGLCQILSLVLTTRLVTRKLGLSATSVRPAISLFACSVALGAGESAVASLLSGAEILLVIPLILVALAVMRVVLATQPSWALEPGDVARVASESDSRGVRLLVALARGSGLIADQPAPERGENSSR